MVGLVGVIKTALAPTGQVAVHGESVERDQRQPLQPGDRAEVIGMDGLTLRVRTTVPKKGVHDVFSFSPMIVLLIVLVI